MTEGARLGVLPEGRIDHIGIAVSDLEAACARFVALLGANVGEREVVEDQQVEVVFLQLPGSARIELIAPLQPGGALARFLEKRGESLHHVCVLVSDLDEALRSLEAQRVPCLDQQPRIGAEGARVAFLHPKALGGVMLELKEGS